MEPKKKTAGRILLPMAGFLLAAFFALHLAVSYDRARESVPEGEKFNYSLFFADANARMNRDPFGFKVTGSTPEFIAGAAAIYLFLLLYIYASRRKYIAGKEYGTARWGTAADIRGLFAENIAAGLIRDIRKNRKLRGREKRAEIAGVRKKYQDADMLLTATERASIYNFQINNNTLVIGGAGSGKTRGYVMPNLLQAHSSYIVTDPKGEILEKSGTFLEGKGYRIRVLNLDEKKLSAGYNPFVYVHMDRDGWEERILMLIETIIVNTDGDAKGGATDPFWEKAERLFLQALFFFTAQGFPPDESNMNTVMDLIRMLELPESEDLRDSDLDFFCECFAGRYGEDHIGVRQYNEFRSKSSGKTAKSIVISAVARLAPFQVAEVRRIFSRDEMRLDLVGEEKTAVFVIVPPTDKTYNFIAGILFTQLFQELNYCALNVHKHDGQRLPVPCRFILDEFANTCRIPNFVEILAYARSLGIGITTILQSLEQIKKIYEKDWGVIIDNSNTLLYLGAVTHMETLKYLSELLGKGTYDKKNLSMSRTGKGSSSQTLDRFGRELLAPDEIRMMKRDRCLLIVGGMAPFYSAKYNYKQHKNYRHTSDGDKKNSYQPSPPPAGAARPDGPQGFPGPAPVLALPQKELALETDQEAVLGTLMGNVEGLSFTEYANTEDGQEAAAIREALPGGDIFESLVAEYIETDESPSAIVEAVMAARADPDSIGFHHIPPGEESGEDAAGLPAIPGLDDTVGDDFMDLLAGIDLDALAS